MPQIRIRTAALAVMAAALTAACSSPEAPVPTSSQPSPASQPSELQHMADRFAPTDLRVDLSKLSQPDRDVLAKLVEASKITDALFLGQVWEGNDAMLVDLAGDQSAAGRERLHYFLINKGPWSRPHPNNPFVAGAPAKPARRAFYPAGRQKARSR